MTTKTLVLAIIILAALDSRAQIATGGTFSISQTAVAGGGRMSGGGTFGLEGTTAQSAAGGPLQSGSFSIYSGFWSPPPLAPTAANVSITGRALTSDGRGIRGMSVTLVGPEGDPRTVLTSSLGYYTFQDLPAGEIYVVSISGNRYTFAQATLIVHAVDSVVDADFVAEP